MVTALINKMSITDKLPDKPSELIRLALHDLELCEQDDRYIIDMGKWHRPEYDICAVCLAGSVMAKSLNKKRHASGGPAKYKSITSRKLYALNEFRLGNIFIGIKLMLKDSENMLPFIPAPRLISKYDKNPIKFKQQMHQLADDFERMGL